MARSLLLCTTLLSLYTARAESLRILKEKGFPVGLTANSEITVIEKGLDEMWHAYLHCKVKGMHIFVVHLSPSQHAFRMKEAKLLC